MRAIRRWLWAAGVLASAACGLGGWAFCVEPGMLVTRENALELPDWPVECTGLRVAVLADLHVGSPFNGLARLETVVQRTQQAAPDLVLLAGDYVIQGVRGGRFETPETMARVLAGLEAPAGVYAVLGNHDWWLDAPRVQKALESASIGVLEDRAVEIRHGTCRFWLAGVSDFLEGRHDVRAALQDVPADAAVLVLTHNPDVLGQVPARVALTIAGHTHGGQVRIPGLGRPIVPSRFGQRYAIGHIVEDGRHLFVSPGIGTSILPVRFLVPPEISLLTLR